MIVKVTIELQTSLKQLIIAGTIAHLITNLKVEKARLLLLYIHESKSLSHMLILQMKLNKAEMMNEELSFWNIKNKYYCVM